MRGASDDRDIKSASIGADGIIDATRKKSEVADEIPTAIEVSPWKGSEILRLKKEAFAADDLWNHYRDVPGGMELWLKAKEDAAKAEDFQPKKKKMKIVKTRLTPKFIFMLKTSSLCTVSDITDESLAKKSESLRQMYTMRRYIDGKWTEYLNALVQQYDLLGYAEDEDEVTDDEVEKHD